MHNRFEMIPFQFYSSSVIFNWTVCGCANRYSRLARTMRTQ